MDLVLPHVEGSVMSWQRIGEEKKVNFLTCVKMKIRQSVNLSSQCHQ